MALIKCSECKNMISDKSRTGLNCGAPTPSPERTWNEERISKLPLEQQIIERARLAERQKNAKLIRTVVNSLSLMILIFVIVYNVFFSSNSNNNSNSSSSTETIIDPMSSAFIGDEHQELKERIKAGMHNPNSYEFVSGERWHNSEGDFASITFRGTNGFGGVVTSNAVAKITSNGNIISVSY